NLDADRRRAGVDPDVAALDLAGERDSRVGRADLEHELADGKGTELEHGPRRATLEPEAQRQVGGQAHPPPVRLAEPRDDLRHVGLELDATGAGVAPDAPTLELALDEDPRTPAADVELAGAELQHDLALGHATGRDRDRVADAPAARPDGADEEQD